MARQARILAPLLATLLAAALWPAEAEAQRRGPRRGRSVSSVVFVGGIGFPRYVRYDYYDPWYQWGPRRIGPYGDYGYRRFDQSSSLRLQVKPREAQVFVDGYLAGIADEFDGIFQRLRVTPGGHDIALYLDGYRTVQQQVYLGPGSDQSLRFLMEPLAPGELSTLPSLPEPTPAEAAVPDEQRPRRQNPRPERPAVRQDFGTLSVRIQPADAEILVDGERWNAPAGQRRVTIELPIGEHQLEVFKEGYARYTETVLITRGRTLTLNVSLR